MAESLQQLLVTNFGLTPSGYTGSQGAAGYTGSAGTNGYTGSAGAAGTSILISNIQVTDSSYTVLDDTAVDTAGGYVKITGSGFASGCTVLVNQTAATSATFISATEVRAQLPATAAGTYIVYVVNPSGDVAIRVNGVTFSALPAWVTGSSLTGIVNTAISIQLSASSAATYALQAGSSLPSGVTLSNVGLVSGTVTGISSNTVYNFTVVATDAELQDSPRAFALTITASDDYFKYTTLLLSGNGTNLAQNNTFLDGSTNNFTITRNGNTTQGTFTPYGTNWSSYNGDTNDSGFGFNTNAALNMGTGDFTIEAWVNTVKLPTVNSFQTSSGGYQGIIATGPNQSATGTSLYIGTTNLKFDITSDGSGPIDIAHNMVPGTWYHIAVSRSGNTFRAFINGSLVQTATSSASWNDGYGWGIQRIEPVGGFSGSWWYGYVSNFRAVKGTAVYTSAFTPSTTPLTAIAGTSLLTCQSNRFKDNSSNNFSPVFSPNPPTVQRFSPFGPGTAYSASTVGGSAYFDGTGDYLTIPRSNLLIPVANENFTIESWVYLTQAVDQQIVGFHTQGVSSDWLISISSTNYPSFYISATATTMTSSIAVRSNTWNHIAVVRTNTNTITLYVNGVAGATTTTTSTMVGNGSNPLTIGSDYNGVNWRYIGYISDIRIIRDAAVYTSAFTPPTAPLTAIANTQLLLNYTNAGIVDGTMQNNIETVGDAKISTTQSKFGGSSMYFDGAGDYLQIPASNTLNFGTSDFTIECWVYNEPISTNYPSFISSITGWSAGASGHRFDNVGYANKFWFGLNGSGGVASGDPFMVSSGTFNHNQWYHYALTRSGNTWRMFVNGNLENTQTYSGSYNVAFGGMRLGYSTWDGAQGWWQGYLDDVRITTGYARYTANFTPPTLAFIGQ